MTLALHDYYVTFGVRYTEHPALDGGDPHPAGMHGKGYAVIPAPDEDTARAITVGLFGQQWAFIYDREPSRELYPAGPIFKLERTI